MYYFGFCEGIRKLNFSNISYSDLYDGACAEFYDSLVTNDLFDLAIYEKLFQGTDKKILELACGSGRIMLPLLEKGYDMSGVDLSEDMLNILKKKCFKRDLTPDLYKGDMSSFKNEIKYDIVMLSHISISLLEPEKQEQLFYNVSKNLLKEDGIFIFNFMDLSLKLTTSQELKPHYYFNKRKKSFAFLFEKVDLEAKKVFVNLYIESFIDERTKRNIGVSCKNIIDKNEINKFIKQSSLSLIDEKRIIVPEGFIVFYILKKSEKERKIK